MLNLMRWGRLSLAMAAVAMLLAACFRDATESIQEQPVARVNPSPTAVVTDEPTEPPPTNTAEPTVADIDPFALTATAIIAAQTQPAPGADAGASQAQPTAPLIPRATHPPGEDCVHEIRAGETLFQLSLAYGVSVDDIAAVSDIANPDRIGVGQQVTIPECGTTGFIPPPTSIPAATVEPLTIPATSQSSEIEIASGDDTRSALVAQAQQALLGNADTDALDAISAQLSGTATPSRRYTVQQNDTLFEIAARYGTSVAALAALNDIADVDNLNVGDVLQLP